MSRFRAGGLEWGIGLHEPDPEGRVLAHLYVRVPGFEGGFSCRLGSREWSELIQTLERLDAGKVPSASWANADGNVEFGFLLVERAYEGTYLFRPDGSGPTLAGAFDLSQADLRSWIEHAKGAVPRSG